MAQYDVYRNPSKQSKKHYPYLLDIQSPYISEIATRIVIPLSYAASFKNEAMTNLTPEISFEDEQLLLLTPQISSIPVNILSNPVGSLSHFREQIINALDFAITGI
ncbi:CcdB family protein [Saccharophagus degradans]|uniref:Toxin CcdB n=1 Tax=Saccharophagus degradans (strain 2-40 / ATCC 43961 / DSM 17024) TaxID=203122 RepID=Q21DI5_SACD2|nr:CcdB family protein [Saccharophagus degradans]ABD83244.1 CcdB protein [Saccharophagus degradans 2-40]